MNIYITRTRIHEYHTKDGIFEVSVSKSVRGNKVHKISEMFCINDVNFEAKPCHKSKDALIVG